MEIVTTVLILGLGATATMDVFGFARSRLTGAPQPDFRLVGRWLAHMTRGRFRHASIKAAASVGGELAVGWLAHYAIGVGFAALLVGLCGMSWVRQPTPAPALIVGIATVAA